MIRLLERAADASPDQVAVVTAEGSSPGEWMAP